MKRIKHHFFQLIKFSKSSQIALLLSSEIIIGFFLTIFTLAGFLKLGDDVLDKELISFDSSITNIIYSFRNPEMTSLMKSITFFGGDIFLGSATIMIILLLLRNNKKDALVFSFILFFGIGLNLLLKDMFQRPRPHFMPLVHETSYSFPSGHSMNSFIFFTSISFFLFRRLKNKSLRDTLLFLSGLLILLIGISRIYLGAHYPSDILAGYIAGLCWFVMVLLFEKTLIFFKLFKKFERKES